ncbi:hypothetical protein C0991_006918 [Blastosporella zonata]|nr:hypothetical protein C0991_006918 [Blastosporella zonata]
MSVSSQSYTFEPHPHHPLFTTVKRYWKSDSPNLNDSSALTLVLTHGTGFHKEQWEPMIDELYLLLDSTGGYLKIREIWSIDAPNHGDAGVLNENLLVTDNDVCMYAYTLTELSLNLSQFFLAAWDEYGRAIHTFLTSLGPAIDVDFNARRLVGIGHSVGATCL